MKNLKTFLKISNYKMPILNPDEICNCPYCRFKQRDLGNIRDPGEFFDISLEGRVAWEPEDLSEEIDRLRDLLITIIYM